MLITFLDLELRLSTHCTELILFLFTWRKPPSGPVRKCITQTKGSRLVSSTSRPTFSVLRQQTILSYFSQVLICLRTPTPILQVNSPRASFPSSDLTHFAMQMPVFHYVHVPFKALSWSTFNVPSLHQNNIKLLRGKMTGFEELY